MKLRTGSASVLRIWVQRREPEDAPAVQHRHAAGQHRDLEAMLLLEVLDELLESQVALNEEPERQRSESSA